MGRVKNKQSKNKDGKKERNLKIVVEVTTEVKAKKKDG